MPASWRVLALARATAPLLLVLALLVAGAPAWPVEGQRSLVFEHLHADIAVQPSGDLIVTETLRPRFSGEWNGIIRRVELQHTTAAGDRGRLDVQLLSASDGDGAALRFEENRVGGGALEFKMWVPGARNRTAEVVIRYRVRGAIRYFAAAEATPGGTPGITTNSTGR